MGHQKKESSYTLLTMRCKKNSSDSQFCDIHAEEETVINS